MDKTQYVTLDNERLSEVSEKLGLADWRDIVCIRENLNRYGKLPAHSIFKRHTLLCIPTVKCSKWKLAKLVDRELTNIIEMGICTKCNEPEKPDDTVPMLLCDGCDDSYHLSCVKMVDIPEGDWLCDACLEILHARRNFYHNPRDISKAVFEVNHHHYRCYHRLSKKKERMNHLDKEQKIVENVMRQGIEDLEHKMSCLKIKFNSSKINFESEATLAATVMRQDHGITGYGGKNDNECVDIILPNGNTQRIKKI